MKRKVKHLLSVSDLTPREVRAIFDLTAEIKARPQLFQNRLRGKTIGLIFEKPSTRTWVSFEVGMAQVGGSSIYLGPEDISLEGREPTKDVARVLSRYVDAFALRTFSHDRLLEFASYAGKPVINGLSDLSHPCQVLTDFFTIEEKLGSLKSAKVAFVGDGNNVLNSLLCLAAITGTSFSYATPRGCEPKASVVEKARQFAVKSGAKIESSHDPVKTVSGAAVVYTDVWVSMGERVKAAEKKKKFKQFQVNRDLMKHAAKNAFFMHCLPAHRGEEVSDEMFESRQSIVFDQAENRLHVQKAILLKLIEH